MRKLVLIITLLVSFLLGNVAYGADISADQAVQLANDQIGIVYYDINQINREMWDEYEVLVYGDPQDVPAKDQDTAANGEKRYLGYTPMGELLPNPDFPPDHSATTIINNYDWIKEPWKYELLTGTNSKAWDDNPNDELYIKNALSDKFGSLFKYAPPKNAIGWYNVTKILQPRTDYTPGLGRMWHKWDSDHDGIKENWYITVLIPAKLSPDIEVTTLISPSPVATNSPQTAAANFKNNSVETKTFSAKFYAGADVIKTENITLEAGESVTKNYAWTAPAAAGKVILKTEAVPVKDEINVANNNKTTTIIVDQLPTVKEPKPLPCAEKPSITNTWEELYEWQIYHPSSYTDENGNTVDDSWWETLYATPTYTETLKATLTVNTKQGIPTDPDNPKETDRESRASWEIIPYAQKNGLNPNEITRSGYGFEIKLQTTYNNDWEDHVPAGAAAHGGTYKGPDKAEAEFYDTQGCFVKYITLVPTKGKAGDKNITWELPLAKFTFSNGETVYERKHYIDINVPDGQYLVKVTVSGAGKTDLCLIQKKYVTIYGDMYDDIYTRVSSKDE